MKIALAAVALAAVVSAISRFIDAKWEQRVTTAEQAAAAADSVADAIVAEYKVKVAELKPRIVKQIERDTVWFEVVEELRAEPVDTACEPFKAKAVQAMDTLAASVRTWKQILADQQAASARLLVAADSVRGVQVGALENKIYELEHPPGRTLFKRLINPEVKPGFAAGICTDGKPCALVGVTVTF